MEVNCGGKLTLLAMYLPSSHQEGGKILARPSYLTHIKNSGTEGGTKHHSYLSPVFLPTTTVQQIWFTPHNLLLETFPKVFFITTMCSLVTQFWRKFAFTKTGQASLLCSTYQSHVSSKLFEFFISIADTMWWLGLVRHFYRCQQICKEVKASLQRKLKTIVLKCFQSYG